jgi:transposase
MMIQGGMEGRAMPSAVKLREDYSAEELRALARRAKDVNQSRRLLSLAAVRDGMDRGSAAKIGGMDRQTLRDWVHRFNASGPEGLIDNWTDGPKPRLSAAQLAEVATIVEAGPDREKDGVVRWRRIDLKRVIAERFGVEFHERYVGKLLKKLGFSHMSARPRHPAQGEKIVEAFKKLPARAESSSRRTAGDDAGRNLIRGRGSHRPEGEWGWWGWGHVRFQ